MKYDASKHKPTETDKEPVKHFREEAVDAKAAEAKVQREAKRQAQQRQELSPNVDPDPDGATEQQLSTPEQLGQ